MHVHLFAAQFLRSYWHDDYLTYCETDDEGVLNTLTAWAERTDQKETSAVAALLGLFFVDLWGYRYSGATGDASESGATFSLHPEFPVARAGQGGGTGSADAALGWWGGPHAGVPQVLCEFKDIRSGLDVGQNRKGNARSPVKQCADYLRQTRAVLWGNEPVQAVWALVTDMNEFRLYHYRTIPHEYQRFVIAPQPNDPTPALVQNTDEARFQRFLFARMFARDWLIADRGPSALERLLDKQWTRERELENEFYREYRAFREHLYTTIKELNHSFSGTPGQLVRLTQRVLDRLIFLLYAEDIGSQLGVQTDFLRDLLMERASAQFYTADGADVWASIQSLFRVLNTGGTIGTMRFFRFNGGLFRDLPELQRLVIPNHVFCTPEQIRNPEAVAANRLTLLYFSAGYNFGYSPQNRGESLSLYALGRIFEQSITELEILEAQADGRPSVHMLSKRKRDGVYYTPEWVTAYLVEHTVGAKLNQFREQSGYLVPPVFSDPEIEDHQLALVDRRRKPSEAIDSYLTFLDRHEEYLSSLTVVDPACGSGAFLIQAFDRIYKEYLWLDAERRRVSRQAPLGSTETYIKQILSNNLYGVDINPESVEIAKLALWLHTVRPNTPLSDLDRTIRCGNSLVAQDFYFDPKRDHGQGHLAFQHDFTEFDEATRERINAFDWDVEFQEITARGGFDCVVGNPPYVKLQHFRKTESAMAEYLVRARTISGDPLYASTQTGNFDLYLPFIERSVRLLHPDGIMGFIAPNVWLKNDYGKGLRRTIIGNRRLLRWVEFGSFQVFEEATTYTALQFFAGSPQKCVDLYRALDGDISQIEWGLNSQPLEYEGLLADGSPIHLVTPEERRLMVQMESVGPRLDDPSWTKQIMQGLITSKDDVYHLRRIASGKYERALGGGKTEPVVIEDAIMHPLVSGPDTKRYIVPAPDTYILFPYEVADDGHRLIPEKRLKAEYPLAWDYLRRHEDRLRGREGGKFDDAQWYRFGRNQSIDKQETAKICVASTVSSLQMFFDFTGAYYINNVRVNGILGDEATLWYVLGVLNSKPADYYFRLIAKPKDNEFFEANKQFIAPIPVPNASQEDRDTVSTLARTMQELATERDRLRRRIGGILQSRHCKSKKRPLSWIVGDESEDQFSQLLERLQGSLLQSDGNIIVDFRDGELVVRIADFTILDQVFVSDEEGLFIRAQWSDKMRRMSRAKRTNPRAFLQALRVVVSTDNEELISQVIRADTRIREVDIAVGEINRHLEQVVARLYGLDDDLYRIVRN